VVVNVVLSPKGVSSGKKMAKRWKKKKAMVNRAHVDHYGPVSTTKYSGSSSTWQRQCFLILQVYCSQTSSIRDNQTSTAVPRPHDTFPPSSLREHFQHLQFTFLYSLHQTRSCKLLFHLFHIISNPKFNVHSPLLHTIHYFISRLSSHVLVKAHNLFNPTKTLQMAIVIYFINFLFLFPHNNNNIMLP